ncbi:MAG TPA: flavin reductase family protein [Pseudonocardiaceae bacterium]|nr:flavin reductase family protein [Pseudonocardiaceae bacterium]
MDPTEKAFVEIAGGLDYLMLVVTATGDDGPAGCLVGFSTQCSIHPPRYLVCLSDKNRTERVASRADVLAVHFIGADAMDLARLFGEETTDETDTFARCDWRAGPSGVPILNDCRRWFAGRILERRVLGDHVGFLLDPIAVQNDGPEPGLFFQHVKHLDPGHEP